MKVFVTGATGFIGLALIPELLEAGHQVQGLARSDKSAKALTNAGAEAHRGSLDDLDSLRRGATAADGVIHLGFVIDFTNFAAAAETDRRAIEALGDALAGTNRPLVTTSGVLGLAPPGRLVTELDAASPHSPRHSDAATLAQVAKGVRASVVRLAPLVHDSSYCGFAAMLIQAARQQSLAVYSGDGHNRWPAVHRLDAAKLFQLALERGVAGAIYHGVAEEGIPMRELMTVIGRQLNLPVASKSSAEAEAYLGPIASFTALDAPSSSVLTQQQLGWHPSQPGILADLEEGRYFGS
ncbi:SDR family oxidoreductase [Hymenobacter sp.]|jgi:nucleoside-diphosphate-sugar epimerase|uniref:SDR family oxidoreductase n=1 Tax=Hymenobacter sp. TaxID=1898978 RepID=UPI002EDB4547